MASSFFSPKSLGTRILTGLTNLIIVNLVFIITCIHFITIGASVTALYRITIAIVAGDNPSVLRDYFKSFKDNFVKSTLFFILYLILGAFFGFEIYMVRTMMAENMQWVQYPAYFFIFAIFASACYAFPLIAWFEESFKQVLKNSLLIALTNLPFTIMQAVIAAVFILFVDYNYAIPLSFACFMGIAAIAWFYSLFLKRIFARFGADINFNEEEETFVASNTSAKKTDSSSDEKPDDESDDDSDDDSTEESE